METCKRSSGVDKVCPGGFFSTTTGTRKDERGGFHEKEILSTVCNHFMPYHDSIAVNR